MTLKDKQVKQCTGRLTSDLRCALLGRVIFIRINLLQVLQPNLGARFKLLVTGSCKQRPARGLEALQLGIDDTEQ